MLQDIKFALRTFRKNSGFTAVVLLTLALGIGANTAIFSVVYAVLLRPLPFPDANRLTMLWETFPGSDRGAISVPNLEDWRKQNTAFDFIEVYDARNFSLWRKDNPEQATGTAVSAGFLPMLGLQPIRGRWFAPGEDRGVHRLTVLSAGLWRRRFGGDPNLVGTSIRLDGVPYTVIGIAPDLPFGFLFAHEQTELWVPQDLLSRDALQRGGHYLRGMGRLHAGVSLEQARQQMNTVAERLLQIYPGQRGRGIALRPAADELVRNIRPILLALLAAAGLVLLIACANIANMLLARAAGRRSELALRAAIGASSARLVRQLLTEALLLSGTGALFGILLASWAVPILVAALGAVLPRVAEIRLDPAVLSFTAVLALATGLLFGALPAWQPSRSQLHGILKEGGRQGGGTGARARSLLVVFEVALSIVLLIGAGLLAKSFTRLQEVQLGLRPENVLTMRVQLPALGYPDQQARAAFYSRALVKLSALPGVRFAGATSQLPVDNWGLGGDFEIEGQPQSPPEHRVSVEHRAASAEFFRALGIPLVEGRYFAERDTAEATRVAIVNRTMASRYVNGGSALGKRIRFRSRDYSTIIGVVENVRQAGPAEPPMPEIYVPYAQAQSSPLTQSMSIALRTEGDPAAMGLAARHSIAEVDPSLAVAKVRTLETIVSGSSSDRRLNVMLVSAFAALALLLALIGIHGVMSYSVKQRVQEIGIRMALGAQQGQVMRMILGQGVGLAFAGVVVGLIAAYFFTTAMASLLFEVRPNDPAVFAAVPLSLLATAAIAAYLPARRATEIDPLTALRHE